MSRIVTFTVKAKQGKTIELRSALTSFIAPSRAEPGCLAYHINQSVEDPEKFLVYMIWEDEESLKHHEDSEKIKNFRETQARELIEGPISFQKWEQLG